MVKTVQEAFSKVSSSHPQFDLSKNVLESRDAFLVLPGENAPEGTPGFRIEKSSGEMKKTSIHDESWLRYEFGL